MVQLGSKARDKITGFTGIVTGYVQYLTGCNQALVQPPAKDGEYKDSWWIDEQRLERVGKTIVTIDNGRNPGFGKAAPKR